jgi:PhnB protein
MTETSNHSGSKPEGWHSVTPRIVVPDARGLVAFLKDAFGATGEYRQESPSEIRIDDSVVMISEAGLRNPMRAFLYVYVSDADATYRRAVEAGARSLEEPADMPYGDRRSMVEDNWGNHWQIATHIGKRAEATTLYLVFRNPGPSWVKNLPSRQQPLWDEHAVFMDRLFEEGRIVLGGPYADSRRVLLVVEARNADEASELFRDDPWARSDILVHSEVIEWTLFLDSRRSGR